MFSRMFLGVAFCVVAWAQVTLAHEGHEHQDSAAAEAVASVAGKEPSVAGKKPSVAGKNPASAANSFLANGKSYVWKHRADLGKQTDQLVEAAKGGLHNSADQDLNTKEIVTVVAKHGLVAITVILLTWLLLRGLWRGIVR